MIPAIRQRTRCPPWLWIALAAVVMGLPTLLGGFVGGDDHRLVLNHVLVNHPSFDNAIKLFTIVHRDLYQPLPLLTFSFEFAFAGAFGWMDAGAEGGAWLFHLTNVLLHAANSVLVWFISRDLIGSLRRKPASGLDDLLDAPGVDGDANARIIASITALLFALHPLQVETVAWVNGRMMLLSTLFGLLAVRTFGRWIETSRPALAPACLFCILLSAISKVRIGLPVLLLLIPLAGSARPLRKWFPLWITSLALTGAFVAVNVWATASADLFSDGAEHLKGPRILRVLLALSFYFRHLVWPTGLASYYPTPPEVHWSDSGNFFALSIVGIAGVFLAAACVRSRAARFGAMWFVFGIGDTLPFFPARNVLAADRYAYLPLIGLLWILAESGLATVQRFHVRLSPSPNRAVYISTMTVLGILLTAQSWYTAHWYNTPLLKTERVARLFPDVPRVWERWGWSLHAVGEYEKALECANRELVHDHPNVRSGAFQLMGYCLTDMGRTEEGLSLLQQAIEVDPGNDISHYRLGVSYERIGRFDDAVMLFEEAIALAPGHNPSLHRLAVAYRRLNRPADARKMYENILINNAYDAAAVSGLAELDITEGTPRSLAEAERRLRHLLSELPENIEAAVNLGVVLVATGRTVEAAEVYESVLTREPDQRTAMLNLGQLYHQTGNDERAAAIFDRLADAKNLSPEEDQVVRDHFAFRKLWRSAEAALSLLENGKGEDAWPVIEALSSGSSSYHRDARRQLLDAIQSFDEKRPGVAWTYALAARLLIAEDNLEPARAFVKLCEELCTDDACRDAAGILRKLLTQLPVAP